VWNTGRIDNNDDVDSVWGFNSDTAKVSSFSFSVLTLHSMEYYNVRWKNATYVLPNEMINKRSRVKINTVHFNVPL
jgi:hypothetical protein